MEKWRRALGDARVWYRPHEKQREFHRLGSEFKERLFLAGNRVGKTLAGAAEVGFHLTGLYLDWWEGVRFGHAIEAWAASVTREATRDILQPAYVGRRGVVPKRLVAGMVLKGGVAGAVDVLKVRHAGGGVSVLGFKSYDQGRESFQGTARHVVHLDEEPELDVYEECLLRTMTVGGHMVLTMTPLKGMTPMVRHFVEGEVPGCAVVRAGWGDAAHLKPGEVGRLAKVLDARRQQAARLHQHLGQLQTIVALLLDGKTRQALLAWNTLQLHPALRDIKLGDGGETLTLVDMGGRTSVLRVDDLIADVQAMLDGVA